MAKEPTKKEQLEIQKLELEIKNSHTKLRLDKVNTLFSGLNLLALSFAGFIGYRFIQSEQIALSQKNYTIQEAAFYYNAVKDKTSDETVTFLKNHTFNPIIADLVKLIKLEISANTATIKQNDEKDKLIAQQTNSKDNIREQAQKTELVLIERFCIQIDEDRDRILMELDSSKRIMNAEIQGLNLEGKTSGVQGKATRANALQYKLNLLESKLKENIFDKDVKCLEPLRKLQQ